jgi:preprotein translocase subunit SecD
VKRDWWYRFSFLLFLVLLSVIYLVPTAMKFDRDSSYPIKSRINLGLDLQGGLYMVLGIDFRKVFKDEVRGYIKKIEYSLNDEGIKSSEGTLDTNNPEDPVQSITIENPAQVDQAKDIIKKYYTGTLRLTKEEGNTLFYGLAQITRGSIEEQSVSKSIEVIRNRIDEFGVTEPEITSQGKDRIVVQLPGVRDIERAKELIGRTAKLEFKLVNDEVPRSTLESWVKKTEDAGINHKKGQSFSNYVRTVNEHLKNDLPAGYEIAFEKQMNFNNEITSKTPFLVEANAKITGEALQDARVQFDQQKNEPYVGLTFKSAGSKMFEEVTGQNIGRRLAIILDGNVYSAPNIQSRIAGGHAQITLGLGNYQKILKEAKDLALVLRAGALPVQLDFLEQRTIGPNLGQDSIHRAVVASSIACIFIFIFAIFYYRFSGVIAVATLLLNVLFTMAILVGFDATLTLPGIAGIALTVGMAIDGNIIIYERIREDIGKGIGFYKSVEEGFATAFWTILDANITTALAGICLLNFGTGPIKGFAVTLLIGILSTVYTCYFVSKIMFEFYINKTQGAELSI